jgi:hypothetical protein
VTLPSTLTLAFERVRGTAFGVASVSFALFEEDESEDTGVIGNNEVVDVLRLAMSWAGLGELRGERGLRYFVSSNSISRNGPTAASRPSTSSFFDMPWSFSSSFVDPSSSSSPSHIPATFHKRISSVLRSRCSA